MLLDTGTDVRSQINMDSTSTGAPKNPGLPFLQAPSPSIIYSGNSKLHLCQCGHKTKKKGDMRRHLESLKHAKKQYTCLCGESFTRKDALRRHEKKCKKLFI